MIRRAHQHVGALPAAPEESIGDNGCGLDNLRGQYLQRVTGVYIWLSLAVRYSTSLNS